MKVHYFLIFSLFIFGTVAWSKSLEEIPAYLEITSSKVATVGDSNLTCKDESAPFRGIDDFFNFVCQQSTLDDAVVNEMKLRGGENLLGQLSNGILDLNSFKERYNFFSRTNSEIAKNFNVASDKDWVIESPNNSFDCRYKVQDQHIEIQEANFKNVYFLGIKHLYQMPPEDQKVFRSKIFEKFKNHSSDAFIIEGYEYGKSLSCERALRMVFTPDDFLQAESDIAIKYGFMNKIALIPGDNQHIDPEDISLFFSGDLKKVSKISRDLEFIDVLHGYYSELLKGNKNSIQNAISQVQSRDGKVNFDPKSFGEYYKQLNGRDLPTDPKVIYQDFTPSIYLAKPLGSNLVVDIQDDLRNRSLLKAIQVSSSVYEKPLALFGSGHLAVLGSSLEKNLGEVKLGYKPSCGK